MLSLLLIVLVCGLLGWIVSVLPILEPFKTIGYVILIIIILVSFFQIILGVNFKLPLN